VSVQRRVIPTSALLASLAAVLALVGWAAPSTAQAQVARWDVITRSAPTHLVKGKKAAVEALLVNLGDAPVEGTAANPVVVTDTLPAGVKPVGPTLATADTGVAAQTRPALTCEGLRCSYVGQVPPLIAIEVLIPVVAEAEGPLGENTVRVEGGNAAAQSAGTALSASASETTQFGVERFELNPEEEDGSPALQAGVHPFQLTTTLNLNQTFAVDNNLVEKLELPGVPAQLRNVITTLPAGLVANTTIIPQCADVDFTTIRPGESNLCAPDTAVGAAIVTFKEPFYEPYRSETVPVFNLVPAPGEPARFGFEFDQVPVTLDTSVKTGEGYAAEVTVANASETAEVLGTVLTVWGVPGDPRHDNARGWECLGGGHFVENLEPRPACNPLGQQNAPPYLLMPATSCSQPWNANVRLQSWQKGAELLPPVAPATPHTPEGCNKLPFNPSIGVAPDQQQASTPSGLNVTVTVPQDTTLSASGLSEADIKATTLALPTGVTASAGAANGLGSCGVAETGFFGAANDTGAALQEELEAQRFTPAGVACPDASKIGEVAVHSPLLENELKGFVYLGQQDTNPFISPLVLYLIAEDPVSGVRVKLAGEVKIDPNSGQLVSVFANTPPLPFQTLKLHLFDGPRASQATPADCGTYQARASFTTWNAEPGAAAPTASAGEGPGEGFQITSGPGGGPCPPGALPFGPSFSGGATNTQAGAFSPFEITLGRPDGHQGLTGLSMRLPQGAAAMLSSATPCPIALADVGGCGPSSLIGHAVTSSGLGSAPVTLGGEVFLTESPKPGAPFGVSVKTPAEHVGPFNIGTIIANSTIQVDPNTAAATITAFETRIIESDGHTTIPSTPLPTIIKGVPVQLKMVHVSVDRPNFEFNPTNCSGSSDTGAPIAITDTLSGAEGGSSTHTTPYGVTGCSNLSFSPKLTASVVGPGSKPNGTTFTVKVEAAKGQANIAKTFLQLPIALPSRLSTIQQACLAATFEANPASCDEGSNIGYAVAHTPVLKKPLVGPAYLVSHGNAAFPDVEFVLQGEGITILLDGKTDIKHGITYSRFETLPDAPVETFETVLPAGPHSALTANVPESEHFSLCKAGPLLMPTEITGQNGALLKQTTNIAITGCSGVASFKAESKLARALKACRSKFKGKAKKKKRLACEKQARKKYGPKGKSKKASRNARRH
jgi:hypothetical protein